MTETALSWLITLALSAIVLTWPRCERTRTVNQLKREKITSDLHWLLLQCEARLILAFGDEADHVPLSVIYDEAGEIAPWIVRIGAHAIECLDYPGNCPHAALAYFVAQGIPLCRVRLLQKRAS